MTEPTMRILSLGAGVQSTTLALLSARGELPRLDAAIFADTGWEPRGVYDHLDRLEREVLTPAGIPLYRVNNGNIRDDVLNPNKMRSLPAHTRDPKTGEDGMLGRKCTQIYKFQPLMGQVRLLLGAKVGEPKACGKCDGTGVRVAPWRAKRLEMIEGPCSVCDGTGEIHRIGQPPAGRWAEQWVGFSTDEITRVSSRADSRYSRTRYPLLELDMSRVQCEAYLKAHGWGDTTKSACIGCPFHRDLEWRRIRDTEPESWDDAVEFDEAYRNPPGLNHEAYLHPGRVPLRVAPIDRKRPSDWIQASLVDAVYEVGLEESTTELEEEPQHSCSPFGCDDGDAVA